MRYIGIEIECIVNSVKELTDELKNNNLNFIYVGIRHKHTLVNGIKLIRDYSIKSGNKEGIEINTPIFNNKTKEFSFDHLNKLCKMLNQINTSVNESCSLHLHINSSMLDNTDKEKLFTFFTNNEHLILEVYHDIQGKKDCLNEKLTNYTLIDLQNNDIPKKVNFNINKAFENYKTIEVRCMCSTINYEEIKELIIFSLNFFEYGLKNSDYIFKSKEDLLNSINGYYSSYDDKSDQYRNKKIVKLISFEELENIQKRILETKKEIYSIRKTTNDINRICKLKKELRNLEIYKKISF